MTDIANQKQDDIHFQITVKGWVNDSWSKWLGNISIDPKFDDHSEQITIFTGNVSDQAALRGLMNQLWDLNLVIILFQQIDTN
ncbi:MAG: hypothetical protein CL609_02310 [Anaerolineaceae bacterium]|nr:hypothetical protein [Anaerolineaceae bacterium]